MATRKRTTVAAGAASHVGRFAHPFYTPLPPSERQPVDFKVALKMPTKAEAIGRVIGMALSPASRLVSQILAPASNIAGQIKTLAEREPAEAAAPGQASAAG